MSLLGLWNDLSMTMLSKGSLDIIIYKLPDCRIMSNS